MADEVVPFEGGWVQIARKSGKSGTRPTVTLRSTGAIGLSVDFVRIADVAEHTHVNVYLSADGMRIGMRFHSDASQADAFRLCKDGGQRMPTSRSRLIQVGSLRTRSAVFAKLCSEKDGRDRTFQPHKDVHGFWAFDLRPCFEQVYDPESSAIRSGATGIYRYLLNGEIVYVGRGRLLDRFAAPDRKAWQFDRVEYSILNNAAAESKWEAYWLDRFRSSNNRLPIYNLIGGRLEGLRIG